MADDSKSILRSVKKMLGVSVDYDVFDLDIIIHINSVFVTLSDLGAGPAGGFMIEDDGPTWDDYMADDLRVNSIKQYMYLVVRSYFDPPTAGYVITAMEKQIAELTWRINVRQESTDYFHEVPGVDISLPIAKRPDPVTDVFQ